MAENDKIVTRYMDDKEFGSAAFAVLSKAIYDSIPPDEATPSVPPTRS
jgi:type I restriction enzyme R subunit